MTFERKKFWIQVNKLFRPFSKFAITSTIQVALETPTFAVHSRSTAIDLIFSIHKKHLEYIRFFDSPSRKLP